MSRFSINALIESINIYIPRRSTESVEGVLQDRSKPTIIFSMTIALCGAVFAPLYHSLGSTRGAIAIILADILILLTPYILKQTASTKIAGNWVIVNIYWLLIYLASINGGPSGPSLYWTISLPLAATMLAGNASAFFWTVMITMELAVFHVMMVMGFPFAQDFTAQGMQTVHILSLIFLGSVILAMSYLYEYFNKEAMNIIRSLSISDELTQIFNRRGFLILADDRLKNAARDHRKIILIFIDIDKLKTINDTLGHREGDTAIVNAARVLKSGLRKSDITARIGGDEFVVMSTEQHPGEAGGLKKRILESLAQFNQASGLPYPLSFSLGVHSWDPENPISMEKLLEEADKKMYEEKRRRV